jgi:hypothetical protein
MQENFLTRFERGQLKQIKPNGRVYLRQRSGLGQGHSVGNRQHMPSVDNYLFGHPTPGQQGADPITDLPGRTRADLADHPRTLKTQCLTGSRRWRIKTGFL